MSILDYFRLRHRPDVEHSNYERPLRVEFVKRNPSAWLCREVAEPAFSIAPSRYTEQVESIARSTQALGPQPLWEGYAGVENYPRPVQKGAVRTSEDVRTSQRLGNFMTWLISARRPDVVLEFGTAFGVSGMYFLAGLETNSAGRLLTFEPNEVWATIAAGNLARISNRFQLVHGTFEDNADAVLGNTKIDIAFIDAIHTSEFVDRQFSLVSQRLTPGGIILLDDIKFSSDMRQCWQRIATSDRVVASANISGLGIVELPSE